jgi:hypothetical protein
MSWIFTTQSRDVELIRPVLPQFGTIQRPRRLRLLFNRPYRRWVKEWGSVRIGDPTATRVLALV